MTSILLSVAARAVAPLLALFSVHMLLRGHNEPGGGFIGGLVAASAVALWVLADGAETVRPRIPVAPLGLMATGLFVAILAGLWGLLVPAASSGVEVGFLRGVWASIETPLGTAKLGTPLLFDLGVYLAVVGAVVSFVFSLEEVPVE